jgi:hypothetical protein
MAKTILYVFGTIFTLVGILGFFIASPLLGIFEVNALHNAIHLVTGIIMLAVAFMWEGSSRMVAQIFGVVYALVAILGFVMGEGMLLGLIPINMEDNILHTAVALVLLYAGFMARDMQASSMGASMSASM